MEESKETHDNTNWDKNDCKNKNKNKDENVGFSESDINAKLKKNKRINVDINWDEKPDLGEFFFVKLFRA